MANDANHQRPEKGRRFLIFQILWIVASVVLMISTWRLWVGTHKFPQIPLLSVFVGTSLWIDYVALAILAAASLLMIDALVRGRPTGIESFITPKLRLACLVWVAALTILFLTNQHRLQPWAWQFLIFAVLVVLSTTKQSALAASRAVVVSIYLWSAIGKFDFQFLNGLGRQFAAAITDLVGSPVNAEAISPWAVSLLPMGELLVGVLLIFSATRKIGVIAAIGLHLGLVAILGPWGMDHHMGVVIWNLLFAMITAVAFWPPSNQTDSEPSQQSAALPLAKHAATILFTTVVIALPMYSLWDHWLAWGLYSPNNRRCTLKVVVTSEQNFDESIQPFLSPVEAEFVGGVELLKVDIGRMSLELLDAPIYPEARMQLGVARWVQERYLSGPSMITIESKSDRFTGEREVKTIEPIQSADQRVPFFFNHLPR